MFQESSNDGGYVFLLRKWWKRVFQFDAQRHSGNCVLYMCRTIMMEAEWHCGYWQLALCLSIIVSCVMLFWKVFFASDLSLSIYHVPGIGGRFHLHSEYTWGVHLSLISHMIIHNHSYTVKMMLWMSLENISSWPSVGWIKKTPEPVFLMTITNPYCMEFKSHLYERVISILCISLFHVHLNASIHLSAKIPIKNSFVFGSNCQFKTVIAWHEILNGIPVQMGFLSDDKHSGKVY